MYRALFLKGEGSIRSVYSTAKLTYTVIIVLSIIIGRDKALLILLLAHVLMGALFIGREWASASIILSSIPAGWYALTAYTVSLLGIPPYVSLVDALMIYARVLSYSITILFIAYMVSPVRLANILIKMGKPGSSIMPLLTWRLMPLGLKFMRESMMIGSLKGEPASRRLAPALAALLEAGGKTLHANYHRLGSPPIHALPVRNNVKYTVVILSVGAAVLIIQLVF